MPTTLRLNLDNNACPGGLAYQMTGTPPPPPNYYSGQASVRVWILDDGGADGTAHNGGYNGYASAAGYNCRFWNEGASASAMGVSAAARSALPRAVRAPFR